MPKNESKPSNKVRLDELLLRSGLCSSLDHARRLIGAGEVYIDGSCVDKKGNLYSADSKITIKNKCPYVSRGGYKLEGGLREFSFNPSGLICVDIGASTGGFTDCLLQNGAQKVYAVDVAYGMLDWKLRQDERVIVIERFNARKIGRQQIPERIDLAVIDAAFISLTKLIPSLIPLFSKELCIICLIKPQFELPKKLIPKGGVVITPEHQQQAIKKITSFVAGIGLQPRKVAKSPVLGPKGNQEFLLLVTN